MPRSLSEDTKYIYLGKSSSIWNSMEPRSHRVRLCFRRAKRSSFTSPVSERKNFLDFRR